MQVARGEWSRTGCGCTIGILGGLGHGEHPATQPPRPHGVRSVRFSWLCYSQGSAKIEDMERLQQKAYREWEKHSVEVRSKHRVSAGAKPWTQRAGVQLLGVPCLPRVHDVLDCVWGVALKQAKPAVTVSTLRKGLWVDLSQDILRQPLTERKRARMPAMCTGSVFYNYEVHRIMSGKVHLLALGHPNTRMSQEFKECHLRRLAGEGFSIPCAAVVSFVMFSNPYGSWWR